MIMTSTHTQEGADKGVYKFSPLTTGTKGTKVILKTDVTFVEIHDIAQEFYVMKDVVCGYYVILELTPTGKVNGMQKPSDFDHRAFYNSKYGSSYSNLQ